MLNISENSINDFVQLQDFKSYQLIKKSKTKWVNIFLIGGLLLGLILGLFLPWTQTINAKGYVTTRSPEQRPQAIQSVISGKLEKWYVQEGDFVQVGDTIIFLTEIKSEYFDPDLIARTTEQINAKSQSVNTYDAKVRAIENQYAALLESLDLKRKQTQNKILQAKNKIKMDSVNLIAFQNNLEIAKNQLDRTKELYEKGLKTLSDFQAKELKLQESSAKVSIQQNKLTNQKMNSVI